MVFAGMSLVKVARESDCMPPMIKPTENASA